MSQSASQAQLPALTIGHSTRTLEAFLQLLLAHGVEQVVDVRTVPRLRRNPQFNLEKAGDGRSCHCPLKVLE